MVDVLTSHGFSKVAGYGVIGNCKTESSLNPHQHQIGGGGGYGLNQWTPQESLYTTGALVGLSRAECETVTGQTTLMAKADQSGGWLVPAGINYIPGATESLTFSAYKKYDDITQATIDWEVHFGRGYIPTLKMNERIDNAKWAAKQLDGYTGGGDNGDEVGTKIVNMIMDIRPFKQ